MSHTTPTVVVDSGASVIEGAEMNANELADKLEQGHWEGGTREQVATMLRQQQEKLNKYELRHVAQRDRIAILEMQHKQQQAEIEALKAKTLTDEEIREFITVFPIVFTPMDLLGFARAILRKAQDK